MDERFAETMGAKANGGTQKVAESCLCCGQIGERKAWTEGAYVCVKCWTLAQPNVKCDFCDKPHGMNETEWLKQCEAELTPEDHQQLDAIKDRGLEKVTALITIERLQEKLVEYEAALGGESPKVLRAELDARAKELADLNQELTKVARERDDLAVPHDELKKQVKELTWRNENQKTMIEDAERDTEAIRAQFTAERQKNLWDRRLFIFVTLVQTWLTVPPTLQSNAITNCRAAWIQGQAFMVPPSVLGELNAGFNKEGSLAWQACDFVKTLCKDDLPPAWTILR